LWVSPLVTSMKAIAINGSPRKACNTATLLQKALDGAEAAGANIEMIHLYDLDYKGCNSCFACKLKNRPWIRCCVMKDGLTGLLHNILASDVILLGSPIYLGSMTGEMHSFFDRLIYPVVSYRERQTSDYTGRKTSGFIYTMNVTKSQMEEDNYRILFERNKKYLERFNGPSEYMLSMDTYQFDDYTRYDASKYDEKHKAEVRKNQFAADCRDAFEMGARLVMA